GARVRFETTLRRQRKGPFERAKDSFRNSVPLAGSTPSPAYTRQPCRRIPALDSILGHHCQCATGRDAPGRPFRTVRYGAPRISFGSLEGSSRESPTRSPIGDPPFSKDCFYRESRAMSASPFSLLFGPTARVFSFFTASPCLISASRPTIPPLLDPP